MRTLRLNPQITPPYAKSLILAAFTLLCVHNLQAQSQNWWKVDGNSNTTSTSFIGTTNSQPLNFKTDNTTRLQLPANGGVVFNHLQNIGTGLVKYDNNGNLIPFTFTTDSTKVLYADGTWRSINFTQSGWTLSGNKLYNTTQNIGIGTGNPQFKLDVNGNARITGTLYAGNILITDNVVADTASVGVINLGTGSSIVGNTNIIGNSTVTGNVGIGTGSPTVKLDVNGSIKSNGTITANTLTINQTATFTDKIATYRIIPLPGDSLIRLGDSTLLFNSNSNNIQVSPGNSTFQGMGIGVGSFGFAPKSLAIGYYTRVGNTATNSIVMGSGAGVTPLFNTISNSLMIGFNSNIPTFFIGSSNGLGTTGNVGIGTTSPTEKLQVNGGNILVKGTNNFSANGHTATLFLGDNNNYIQTKYDFGVSIGVYQHPDFLNITNDGRVGIGTNNPQSLLHVKGQARFCSSSTNYINIGHDGSNCYIDANGTGVLLLNYYSGKTIHVGGGSNTDIEMFVCGKVQCKKIKVQANWCDFVFEKNYKRMSLLEKEQYYIANKHLPYIDTQSEVETDGLDVGKNMAGILQNLEENTIEIVELYKMILELKKENIELKRKIDEVTKK